MKRLIQIVTAFSFTLACVIMPVSGNEPSNISAPKITFINPPDNSFERLKAVALINAPPRIVWEVLTDDTVIYSKSVRKQKLLKRENNMTWLFVNTCIKWLDFSYVLKITQVAKYQHLSWDQDEGNEIRILLKTNDLETTEDFRINKGDWLLAPAEEGKTELTYVPCLALANPLFNLMRGYVLKRSIPELFLQIESRALEIQNVRNAKVNSYLR